MPPKDIKLRRWSPTSRMKSLMRISTRCYWTVLSKKTTTKQHTRKKMANFLQVRQKQYPNIGKGKLALTCSTCSGSRFMICLVKLLEDFSTSNVFLTQSYDPLIELEKVRYSQNLHPISGKALEGKSWNLLRFSFNQIHVNFYRTRSAKLTFFSLAGVSVSLNREKITFQLKMFAEKKKIQIFQIYTHRKRHLQDH